MKINATITGSRETRAILNELNQSIIRKRCRKAMNKALTPTVKAAKSKAPRQTGLTKKAVGKKVKVYGNRSVVGIVGVRTGFRKQIGVRSRGRNAGKPIIHDPAKVAHIVEKEHPWLGPVFEQTKAEVGKSFGDHLGADLESGR